MVFPQLFRVFIQDQGLNLRSSFANITFRNHGMKNGMLIFLGALTVISWDTYDDLMGLNGIQFDSMVMNGQLSRQRRRYSWETLAAGVIKHAPRQGPWNSLNC